MPARLDRWQSITGLILALFIVGHMFFTSSILLGKEAMYKETKLFEGSFFLSTPAPWLVSVAAAIVFALFIVHAGLAMRKFPYKWREYKMLKTHAFSLGHTDTILWMVQAGTGFAMLFLGSIHLWMMMTLPEKIGPYASADRIFSDRAGWLYALLLAAVISHTMIGLYRLSVKWGIGVGPNPRKGRRRNKKLMWAAMIFFGLLGYSALGTYWSIGAQHHDRYGERYEVQP
jgi:fumarate reductase subunit C